MSDLKASTIIALEGLPGAGKTTSTMLLAERLHAIPLTESTANHPFLNSVYDDNARHDLQVELAFLLLHFEGYRTRPRDRAVISDYSPAKDLLFAWDMLAADDLRVFTSVYDHLYTDDRLPELVLYLDVGPRTCLERARARGRDFEAGMELGRLERMDALYRDNLGQLGAEVVTVAIGPNDSPDTVADLLVAEIHSRPDNPAA